QHHAERQDFGEKVRDLARREVHHRQDQLSHEIGPVVVLGDLRARALHAELSEIDPQLVSGFARLGEVLDLDDPAHADVDLGEVVPGDRGHRPYESAWPESALAVPISAPRPLNVDAAARSSSSASSERPVARYAAARSALAVAVS